MIKRTDKIWLKNNYNKLLKNPFCYTLLLQRGKEANLVENYIKKLKGYIKVFSTNV